MNSLPSCRNREKTEYRKGIIRQNASHPRAPRPPPRNLTNSQICGPFRIKKRAVEASSADNDCQQNQGNQKGKTSVKRINRTYQYNKTGKLRISMQKETRQSCLPRLHRPSTTLARQTQTACSARPRRLHGEQKTRTQEAESPFSAPRNSPSRLFHL